MTLHDRVVNALQEAGLKTASEETQSLRTTAASSGWSKEAAASLEVHHNLGEFHASFSDKAGDYEFGTEDRPPLSVARYWHNHLDDHTARVLEHHLRESLRGVL